MDFPQTSVDSLFSSQHTFHRDTSFRYIVNSFFQNLVFTRVERRDNYAIYAVKLTGLLGNGFHQYILLFVHLHNAIEQETTIDNLLYVNLQVRSLQKNYKIREQRWSYNKKLDTIFFNMVDRNEERSLYIFQDIELLLKHNPKRKTQFQYPNRVTLTEAFESYNCILQIPS